MISRDCRFFLAVLLTAVPLPSVAADLKIMTEDAAEPFSRVDGTGYANDVVKAAFHAAGVEIQFDVVPYARCKKDVERGKVVACFSMSWYMGVEDTVAFSDLPIIQVYADVCETARREAYELMVQHALDMGADAVIAMRYDATEFSQSVTEVLAYGTAVIVKAG